MVHDYGTLRIHLWFDENDQLIREIDIYGDVKRDVSANGITLKEENSGPVFTYDIQYLEDRVVATVKATGAQYIINIPGHGRVYGGGGQEIYTFTWSPDWEDLISVTTEKEVGNLTWDWDIICEYFAP
jgi:hypothetical protein